MSFTEQELSDFFTHYSTIGDTVVVDTHRLEEHSCVGYGELYFPSHTLEFSVHIVNDRELTDSICMTTPDDNNAFEIILHQNYMGEASFNPQFSQHLEVAVARQLVRFAIEEMPPQYKDLSHSTLGLGQFYKSFPALLDYKPEVQAFFQSRAVEAGSITDKNTYFNLTATALLHGAVNIREFEVDLEMLRLVDPMNLAVMHYFTMKHVTNQAIIRELKNRTTRILDSHYNGNVIHPEYEMMIELC